MKSSLLRNFLSRAWPNKHCLLCHQNSNSLVCNVCLDDLPWLDTAACGSDLLRRSDIRQGFKSPMFDQLFSVAEYTPPFTYLIRQLKFQRKLLHADALARIFCHQAARTQVSLPEIIIPVPVHSQRLAERLYNQAYQIAWQIACNLQLSLADNIVSRDRHTKAQAQLDGAKRRSNLRNAFSLTSPLEKRHVVLFDDVVTTGETANEICRTIRKVYPDIRIDLWTMCISPDRQ